MIGQELAGRYEILARIGGGGMALVYKAQDMLLGRNVAVKVLRQQFVDDDEFVRRFRREAQAAASLSHPNVVSVYDVGQEGDTHYIVMEYVEGSNLNEIILERAPLRVEEAVHIALQICDALDHAHHNQIVHRDIKPHNILIGNNGRVKVTDFGIARAVTSSTITQTGSVVGSVHYFSPEHAKGIMTGEKSDIYSLGIVLYQMLTGKLPFLGESPISVALKHLQEEFEEPRATHPEIPQSVENVILRAMRKNADERYGSAAEMMRDLESCLQPGRLHEAKTDFGRIDHEATRVMPALRGPAAHAVAAESGEARESGAAEEARPKGRSKRPLIAILSTLIGLAVLVGGFLWVLNLIDTDEVDVPYVIGMTEEQALQELEAVGLKIEEPIIREVHDEVEEGVVYDQTKQNMRVKQGALVKLFVSLGPEMEVMDNYEGARFADVKTQLLALGVAEARITSTEEYSAQGAGTVLTQSLAAGEPFNPDTAEFSFVVSQGPEPFEMPELVGRTEQDALQRLKEVGLTTGPNGGIERQPSYKPEGEVIDQFPHKAGDMVTKGEEVTITVSSGLPEEAIRYTFNLSIAPARIGESSDIRIEYTDARGEKIECCTRTIKDWQSFNVEVVLAPNTEALVSIYRDGSFKDTLSITYDEAKAGGGGFTETVPSDEPPPDEPTGGPDDGANGEGAPDEPADGDAEQDTPADDGADPGDEPNAPDDGGADATSADAQAGGGDEQQS
ncbi:Stk1 family PASTA domain-containing Ser/Thr kinase [Paenibacillus sp. IB182496]|uniref:Serine/threonine-protein kinase PrkC n=1 Tax=Paenibacillus sabuli TaxID=2772509 RepID=A0A927BUV0_9BACL|nr:Stk1 family PASTA domain-containing Ser/Thr kinase [Paenibacillus sabuli]MBD2846155.1 Stk1 family PASTA domain-containing Ser/Thr kinase [Paenibacillus sabuli]